MRQEFLGISIHTSDLWVASTGAYHEVDITLSFLG